jgi:hypothetical protein
MLSLGDLDGAEEDFVDDPEILIQQRENISKNHLNSNSFLLTGWGEQAISGAWWEKVG